jgi:hypothetical protein
MPVVKSPAGHPYRPGLLRNNPSSRPLPIPLNQSFAKGNEYDKPTFRTHAGLCTSRSCHEFPPEALTLAGVKRLRAIAGSLGWALRTAWSVGGLAHANAKSRCYPRCFSRVFPGVYRGFHRGFQRWLRWRLAEKKVDPRQVIYDLIGIPENPGYHRAYLNPYNSSAMRRATSPPRSRLQSS